MKKYKYNTEKYKFRELVMSVYNIDHLELIHKSRSDLLPNEKLKFSTESRTLFHRVFYEKMNSEWVEFENAYKNFIKNEIAVLFDEEIIYQYMPSFRIHLPRDQAIHKWHYDSDPLHRHPDWEINCQIALTEMYDTQATWVEPIPGLKDFVPMNMNYGEFYLFNGNKCTHGNKINETDKTRVSFDFRIMPLSRYVDVKRESVTANKKFTIGEYYCIID